MLETFILMLAALTLARWGIIYMSTHKKTHPHNLTNLSIIIPLKGWDNSLPHLVKQLLDQNYPFEIEIFIIADSTNPSIIKIPEDKRIKLLFSKPLQNGWKDKNWRLYQGVQAAKYSTILFFDSDVVIHDRNFLKRRLQAHSGSLSFCMPFYSLPSNHAERFLAAYTNYTNLTLYKTSFALGKIATAIGPSMLFTVNKEILLEGIVESSNEIADDHAIAYWFSKKGHEIDCILEPVSVVKNDETWEAVITQIMRWTLLPKTVKNLLEPTTLLLMGVNISMNLTPALLIYAGLIASSIMFWTGFTMMLFETLFFIFLESTFSSYTYKWRHLIFLPLAMLSYAFIAIGSFFKTIYWRGEAIKF